MDDETRRRIAALREGIARIERELLYRRIADGLRATGHTLKRTPVYVVGQERAYAEVDQ